MIAFSFKILLWSCFVPVAMLTPVGFVSVVDVTVACFFVLSMYTSLTRGRILASNPFALFAFILSFAVVVTVQLQSGLLGDAGTILKHLEFLVLIPLSVSVSFRELSRLRVCEIASSVGWASFLLLLSAAASALLGGKQGFDISIWGAPINKNALGSLLLFGASAWLYLACTKSKWFWLHLPAYLCAMLFFEARSAAISLIFLTPVIYAMAHGGKKFIVWMCAVSAAVLILGVLLVNTPVFLYYTQRLYEAMSLDTAELTSSSSRILLWSLAFGEFLQKPIFGWGIGGFSYDGPVVWLRHLEEPHNFILQIMHNGGLALSLSYLLLFFEIARASRREIFFLAVFLGYFSNMLASILFNRFEGHLFFLISSFAVFVFTSAKYKRGPGSGNRSP
ncbi:O-antigen ligase family protein [Leisingera aquaemixtae]|uniref:O-antigen ligase family protein n=1 Tax=Leisingera aquaemixtae TaxID=1396826 RepID=UPI001C974839|nr:O-antigen ligase family protein [Leisingera aquaemixtae]MBY6069067.1 O-antigen ligase family protein [Leisingera aquaemixtae]